MYIKSKGSAVVLIALLPGPSNKDRGSRDLLRIHGRNFGHQPDRGGPPEGPEPGQARQGEVQAGFVLLVRSLLYLNIRLKSHIDTLALLLGPTQGLYRMLKLPLSYFLLQHWNFRALCYY